MSSSIPSLKRGLLLKLSALLVVLAALLLYSHRTVIGVIHAGREETEILNATGRQRMLVQQFVRQANLALIGLSTGDWATLLEQRKLSAETSAQFDQTMQALLLGGETRLGGSAVTLPRVESAEIRGCLEEVATLWAEVKRASVKVLRSDNSQLRNHPDLALMQSAAMRLVEKADGTLLLMQQRGIQRNDQLLHYQTGLLLGGLTMFVLLGAFVQRSIITPLAAAHGDLQSSEQRFRTLSSSARIGIFLTDAEGLALYLNPHSLAIMGFSQEEALGEGWCRAVHPADADLVLEEWQSASRTGSEFDREYRFVRPCGEIRWVHVRTTAIRSDASEVAGHVGTVEDITQRKETENNLARMHKELLETSRQAGMAEVAISVLHNVGNVLNSVNVASMCVMDGLRKSKGPTLARVVAMLRDHETDLGAFFKDDARAKKLPDYLAQLTDKLSAERTDALKELAHLQKNIEHIKQIVAMQQTYAKVSGVTETVQIADLIEDTLRMDEESLTHHEVRVVRDFAEVPPLSVEKHKVLQILVNLVRNAKHACQAANGVDKTMTLRVFNGDGSVTIAVKDNGIGVAPENLARIFNHGFTTKKDGHGFGLHSGALAAKEMGGALTVHSDGPGTGATFTLKLPLGPSGTTGVRFAPNPV